jgi:hypothetical protein
MTHRAIPARHKGHSHREQGKDKAVPRTQKGWTFEKRCRAKLEGINGIRMQGLKKQPHLRSKRTFGRIFGKTTGLEIVKQIAGSSIGIKKRVSGHCGGVGPFETKEETAHRIGALNVGALTTLGTSGCTNWRKKMVIHLNRLAPYQGAAQEERP